MHGREPDERPQAGCMVSVRLAVRGVVPQRCRRDCNRAGAGDGAGGDRDACGGGDGGGGDGGGVQNGGRSVSGKPQDSVVVVCHAPVAAVVALHEMLRPIWDGVLRMQLVVGAGRTRTVDPEMVGLRGDKRGRRRRPGAGTAVARVSYCADGDAHELQRRRRRRRQHARGVRCTRWRHGGTGFKFETHRPQVGEVLPHTHYLEAAQQRTG